MSNSPEGLRELAEWYRALGKIGCTGERAGRLKFADYLDRLANEVEAHPEPEVPDRRPAPAKACSRSQ